ncbi:hypothetical protein QTP88_010396 [Uroleucon formosanum]
MYHLIVLLACSDADCFFTTNEAGYAGRNSDGGIFRASTIKKWITTGRLNIPFPSKLIDDYNFPFYFVGDEAFPLTPYLLRPYPQKTLDNVKRIFNYRLSRGRKTVKCDFGMMAEKFRVLSSAIRTRNTERVTDIIKSVCILHNLIRKKEEVKYTPYEQVENIQDSIDSTTILPIQDIVLRNRASAHELVTMSISKKAVKRKYEEEKREFKLEWEELYFFIQKNDKPFCLICQVTLSQFKVSNLKRHYETNHNTFSREFPIGSDSRKNKLCSMKLKFAKQTNVMTMFTNEADDCVEASFVIAFNIAQAKRPYTDGEYIKKNILDVISVLNPENQILLKMVENVPVSRHTIERRISTISTLRFDSFVDFW